MKYKTLFLVLLYFSVASAQRFDILSGNLKNLKDISEYNISFIYSNLKVHGFETEEAFLVEKMNKRNNVEGKAESFKKNWFDYREKKYEPKFIAYFNNRFENGDVKVTRNSAAKYTMVIETTWVYPGYFAEPAKISAVFTFIETANPKNVLFSIAYEKSIGIEEHDFNGNLGDRIAGAYEKLAKNITMQLKRL